MWSSFHNACPLSNADLKQAVQYLHVFMHFSDLFEYFVLNYDKIIEQMMILYLIFNFSLAYQIFCFYFSNFRFFEWGVWLLKCRLLSDCKKIKFSILLDNGYFQNTKNLKYFTCFALEKSIKILLGALGI